MADNVAITAGAGTPMATDDVGGVHYQRLKITPGPDGTALVDVGGRTVDGSTVTALYTDPRLKVVRAVQTPVVQAALYALKNAIGGLLTFANAVRVAGGTGRLEKVVLVDKGQQMRDIDLVLFSATVAGVADKTAFDPTDAELLTSEGAIRIAAGDYLDFTDNSVAVVGNIGLEFTVAGTDLFGVLVARGTPTYTSTSDIQVALTIIQE